jgi:hypothetical protein
MLEITEEKFSQKLRNQIHDLCEKSKKLYLDEDKFKSVFKYYKEYNARFHEAMSKKGTKIDRHKIAAAFLCSIIKAKPIGYNTDGIIPAYLEKTVNEQLGFLFGIYVIDTFNNSEEDAAPLDKEIYLQRIQFPDCKKDDEKGYINHFTKLFNDEKVRKELDFEDSSFNINLLFYLSHIFFLIDSFSYYKNAFDLKDK